MFCPVVSLHLFNFSCKPISGQVSRRAPADSLLSLAVAHESGAQRCCKHIYDRQYLQMYSSELQFKDGNKSVSKKVYKTAILRTQQETL